MKILYANNATSLLANNISDSDLSLDVSAGDGVLFPSPTGAECFFVTLSGSTNMEIVKVTARSTDTFTIERAQEGTSAASFNSGDKVELLITAGIMEDLRDNSLRTDGNITPNVIPGLNADKLDGAHSSDFYLATGNLNILGPKAINFGVDYKEDIILFKNLDGLDSNWGDVVLMLSMKLESSPNNIIDSSLRSHPITVVGNTSISSAQSKFGGTSCYFDGNGDYLSIPYTSDFDFSLGSWTVEAWFYQTDVTGSHVIISKDTYEINFDFCIHIINGSYIGCYTNGGRNYAYCF